MPDAAAETLPKSFRTNLDEFFTGIPDAQSVASGPHPTPVLTVRTRRPHLSVHLPLKFHLQALVSLLSKAPALQVLETEVCEVQMALESERIAAAPPRIQLSEVRQAGDFALGSARERIAPLGSVSSARHL